MNYKELNFFNKENHIKTELLNKLRLNSHGIALVTALIITLVVFILVASTLYVITESIAISGAGKRYPTADKAAEGCVDVTRQALRYILWKETESLNGLPLEITDEFINAVYDFYGVKKATVKCVLPGDRMLSWFRGTVTLERLIARSMTSNVEYTPEKKGGGYDSNPVYYRITAVVDDPNSNVKAESVVLYRYKP